MSRARALALLVFTGCAAHKYPDGSGLEGQLEREVVALQQTVHQLQVDCGDPATGGDLAYRDLVQLFSGSETRVAKVRDGVSVVMPSAVLFSDVHAMTFRDEGTSALDLLATVLNEYPDRPVDVLGHTSDRSIPAAFARQFPSLLDLTFAQARAVQRRLTDQFGVPASRFTVGGRADWAPVASNDIPEGQNQNERIEVVVRRAPAVAR